MDHLVLGGNSDLTVRNVKLVGNWRYNTDGVQTGTEGLVVEDCFLQCNDDNFSLNGVCRDVAIRRNVLWNIYNGGVFMFGWATGPEFLLEQIRIHDNVILRAGGCCDYDRKAPFSMKLFGSRRVARDIEIRDCDVEDIAPFGRWIDFQAAQASSSQVADIRLVNVHIRRAWQIEGEVRGMLDQPISGLVFDHVLIGEELMDSPEVGRLSLFNTFGTQINGKTFADGAQPSRPLATANVARSTPVDPLRPLIPAHSPTPLPVGGAEANLLENPRFDEGLDGWETADPNRARTAPAARRRAPDGGRDGSDAVLGGTGSRRHRDPAVTGTGVISLRGRSPCRRSAAAHESDADHRGR